MPLGHSHITANPRQHPNPPPRQRIEADYISANNHRYWFTTWRWGKVLAWMMVIGAVLKVTMPA
ncbi:MAG: hypothetical protein WCJ87_06580 [Burkholderiales bacterium]